MAWVPKRSGIHGIRVENLSPGGKEILRVLGLGLQRLNRRQKLLAIKARKWWKARERGLRSASGQRDIRKIEAKKEPTNEPAGGLAQESSAGVSGGLPKTSEDAPWTGRVSYETYDEPTGRWESQDRNIVISKSTILGDKPWRATVFAGGGRHAGCNCPRYNLIFTQTDSFSNC